jgi:hypothetical protein
MSRQKLFLPSLILILTLAACAPLSAAAPAPDMSVQSMVQPEMSYESAPAAGAAPMDSSYSGSSEVAVNAGDSTRDPLDRIVIRNGNISIIVDDPIATMNQITGMAEAQGGYVISSNVYQTQSDQGLEIPEATVSIRIPAENFSSTMAEVRGLVQDAELDIISENTSAQDFTQDYTDLQSRKTNLEAAADQLNTFMDRATTTEDVLAVYNQLTQVTGELELIKGQIQYYEQSDAFSSISVTLVAREKVQPVTIAGWHPAGIANDAVQALVNTLKVLANIGIWFVIYFIPVAVVLLLPVLAVVLIVRAGVKRRKARAALAKKEEEPIVPQEKL